MNDELKKVFQPGPMVPFRRPSNLITYLVRANMYPMERKKDLVNVRVTGVRYVSMYLKWKHLPAQ